MNHGALSTYQAGVTQAYLNRKLQKLCDDILRPYGITKTQWLVVGTILDNQMKGIRLSDLADKLGTTMSYLTTTINLLESRGILERTNDRDDTRSKQITVADDFVDTCAEIEHTLRDSLRKTFYAKVDPDEFKVYISVMNELAAIE